MSEPEDSSTLRIPTHPPRAPRRRWPRVVGAALLAVLLVGACALASRTQEAVWFLAADQVPDPASTTLTVLVEEVGCSSGERPSSTRPRVELDETTVTIAVRTRARLALSQSCPAAPLTPVTVDLGEPLGDRTLVDAYGDLDDAYGPIESYDPRLRAPAAAQR